MVKAMKHLQWSDIIPRDSFKTPLMRAVPFWMKALMMGSLLAGVGSGLWSQIWFPWYDAWDIGDGHYMASNSPYDLHPYRISSASYHEWLDSRWPVRITAMVGIPVGVVMLLVCIRTGRRRLRRSEEDGLGGGAVGPATADRRDRRSGTRNQRDDSG